MQIPEIHSFSSHDRACILPYRMWSRPILDYLAKWGISVFTCEKEVVDRIGGKTNVFFLPTAIPKIKKDRKKPDVRNCIGFFGEWENPFDSESTDLFQKFFDESSAGNLEKDSILVGGPDELGKISSCRAIFSVQSKPALSPLILHALLQGIPVFVPESSRSFFPADLPVRTMPENWSSILDELLSATVPESEPIKEWRKAYTSKAIQARANQLLKENSKHESAGITERDSSASRPRHGDRSVGVPEGDRSVWRPRNGEEWGTFLLRVAQMEETRRKLPECEEKLKQAKEALLKCGETLSPAGRNNLGVCLLGLREVENAKENFRISGSRVSLYNLASILFSQKFFSDCINCLDKCLSMDESADGNEWESSIVIGFSSNHEILRLSSCKERHDWENLFKAGALHLLSLAQWELRKRGEALQALKEAVALDPGNPFLLSRIAIVYMEKRMVAQPIKVLNQALTLSPFSFGIAHRLACFYCQSELFDQAQTLVEKYLQYPGSMNSFHVKMIHLYSYIRLMRGDLDQAIELMKECLKKEETDVDFETQLALLYLKKGVNAFENGDLAEAFRWGKESLLHDPSQALSLNLLGSISYWKADFEQASQHFKSAALLNPDLSVAQGNIKEAEASKGIAASLIVVSHNEISHASLCLRLLSECCDLPCEIIYLRPSGAPRWDFLENIPNLRIAEGDFSGMAQAYNYGAAIARGKHFIFLEDDVLVANKWLSRLLDLLEQDGVGAAGPVTDYCGNSEQIGIGKHTVPYGVSALDGFCIAVKRQLFKEIGGFDEKFLVRGYEDRDLSLRIQLHGEKLLCHPEVAVYHRGLLPVLPPDANVQEIDRHNLNAFKEKWEAVKSQVSSRVG